MTDYDLPPISLEAVLSGLDRPNVKDIAQRLTAMVEAAVAQRRHITFIAITSMDYLDLTTHVPVDGEMGQFLGIPLRLGATTEVRVRKVPTNV